MDHPEISAGWLESPLLSLDRPAAARGLAQPQVSLDDLYPLLPEDEDATAAQTLLARSLPASWCAWLP